MNVEIGIGPLRPWLLGLFVLACCGSPSIARAEDTKPPSLTESLHGEAKVAYDSARLLYEDGDLTGAFAKFERAYELSHESRLIWNMAVCEKELRHYAASARLVTRYLAEAGSTLSPESREDAKQTLNALSGFYSALTLRSLPVGARVLVDGVVVGAAPLSGPIPVDLGTRLIEVDAAGYERYTQRVNVPGASALSLDVKLQPRARPASVETKSTGLGTQRVTAITATAVGVVGIGISTVFALESKSKHDDAEGICFGSACNARGLQLSDDARTDGNLATAFAIVGAVGVAGGVALWLTAPKRERQAELHAGVGPGGLQLKGRF
ncbi:MAG: PEGA domain-containing protein [Myxococcales bacterium]|nr:MAG: PEGA domain-containing protein [Myxococcales bacterium]